MEKRARDSERKRKREKVQKKGKNVAEEVNHL